MPRPACAPAARRAVTALALAAAALLAGCLEVDQHPVWRDGHYDGKPDNLPHQARFHGDRLGWNAVVTDRAALQDEYRRMRR